MQKVNIEQQDYNLNLVRIEFMNCVSEIASDAWKFKYDDAHGQPTGPMSDKQKEQYHTMTDDIALVTQRWWIDKQTEFISKLIDNYKNNIFFRQLAKHNEKDLDEINEKLKNADGMKRFLLDIHKYKPSSQSIGNNKIENKFNVLNDLLNRVFLNYNYEEYVAGKEILSSLPFPIRTGLLDDLLTSYLSGDYAFNEKGDYDKNIPKHQYTMRYFSFLPMRFESGADTHPKLDLQFFIRYFECYCKVITSLLKIDVVGVIQEFDVPVTIPLRKGGSKSRRKHRKRITVRQRGVVQV
jgi:hypothetical protein